jgi:hypothetical protein
MYILIALSLRLFSSPYVYDAVPSEPMTVAVHRISEKAVVLSWGEPEIPKGNLAGYRIYYFKNKDNNYTDVRTIHSTAPLIKYKLDGMSEPIIVSFSYYSIS